MTMNNGKAVVHISGTLLRRVWHGKVAEGVIVVRPSGDDRDSIGYVVNQVRFTGPTEMIYSVQPRTTPKSAHDTCTGAAERHYGTKPGPTEGFVGTLPGFDNAILVYLEADEDVIQVQPHAGDAYLPFREFKVRHAAQQISSQTLVPLRENNC
jgi:hypothetical protein